MPQNKILDLLNQKSYNQKLLDDLVYGTIEIRINKNNKYIYLHNRIDGIQNTKYVGEYSDELYNLILSNNIKAKSIKKKLKLIDKELDRLGYSDNELEEIVKLNIDLAKLNLTRTIYEQAILEGIATTLADTEIIIDGIESVYTNVEDAIKIRNLKNAWDFILNKNVILSDTNILLLEEINKQIEQGLYYNAGIIRSTPVNIGGTKWEPDIPNRSDVIEEINEIINKSISINTAIELLLYVMKKQIFLDGNKRTAVIFTNHYMIKHGLGLIVVPDTKVEEFKKLLIDYYENNKIREITKFLKDNCLIKIK